MPTIQVSDAQKTLTVESNLSDWLDPRIPVLVAALATLHAAVPVRDVDFRKRQDHVYFTYAIELQDGRAWTQKIWAAPGNDDPTMTFQVPDQWKMSEFFAQRDLRNSCVALVSEVGATRITAVWA